MHDSTASTRLSVAHVVFWEAVRCFYTSDIFNDTDTNGQPPFKELAAITLCGGRPFVLVHDLLTFKVPSG